MVTKIEIERYVQAYIECGAKASSETAVSIVANIKENLDDTDPLNVQTEYLSESELTEILAGFREAGFHTTAYTQEFDFLRWLVGREPSSLKRHAVYAIAQRGLGPGRHALVPSSASLAGMLLLTPEAYYGCLAHHKFHAFKLVESAGLPIPKTWLFDNDSGWANGLTPPDGLAVIAKPNLESASIGIDQEARFVYSVSAVQRLAHVSEKLSQPVIVQEFVSGWEVETPVLGNRTRIALPPVGVSVSGSKSMGDEFLDYSRVYDDNYSFFDFSADEPTMSSRVQELAAAAAQALGLGGICRIDFRISPDGLPYITDITGKPHLTKHSSVAARFAFLGHRHSDIFSALVGIAASPRFT